MKSKVLENKSYWQKHIESYKASGLNKSAYCLRAVVCYHRFLYWFDKLSKRPLQTKAADKAEQFIPVQLAVAQKSKSVEREAKDQKMTPQERYDYRLERADPAAKERIDSENTQLT